MESSLRGHAATFQQQQLVQRQNQMYQQQQQYRRQGGHHQDQMSVGSHYSRDSAASGASSQMDEAYRRLGWKLSARAHGDGPITQPQRLSRIGLGPSSSFLPYDEVDTTTRQNENVVGEERNAGLGPGSCGTKSGSTPMDRTAKVAKKRYSDHGDHQRHHKTPPRRGNLVRRMTINATDLFRLWQSDDSRRNKKRVSPKNGNADHIARSHKNEKGVNDLSPQRFAFSLLDLDGSGMPQDASAKTQQPESLLGGALNANGVGLSAVMETSSSRTSSQSNTPSTRPEGGSVKSRESSLTKTEDASSIRSYPRGKCLTQPSQPATNNGLDNSEGNLIVHENDSISVSRKQIHVLTKDKMNVKRADFRIQGLLGQGTFAQVFQCVHVQTGNLVAIKVVKNKPAYTRQAAVEIDVFRALVKGKQDNESAKPSESYHGEAHNSEHMVDLVCYFMHQNHLCLVFELLGLNLYEVLKKRQFRGLPLSVVRHLVRQAVIGLKELAKRNIVHCDLKPENILLVSDDDVDSVVSAGETRRGGKTGVSSERSRSFSKKEKQQSLAEPPLKLDHGTATTTSQSLENSVGTNLNSAASLAPVSSLTHQNIKLIDFGSACFEGQTSHTYIQSRFYRSPEVLVGLPYDSAIDMWSLGCVAAELFLGLPILPGVHEHDQLSRICEMVSRPSDWMLDQGTKAAKYFVRNVQSTEQSPTKILPQWRIRTQQEYIETLSENEIRKKGGLAKLEKQVTNRYFKRKRLSEIIIHKGLSGAPEDKDTLDLFVHFLYGILDPDPWKRWTAQQAAKHPFLTGAPFVRRGSQERHTKQSKEENQANSLCDIYWEAPWDPNICRRKLLGVQKIREKQQEVRRGQQRGRKTPTRPPSASSQDTSRMDTSSKVGSSPPAQVNLNQQGLGAAMASQHSRPGQLSSSYSNYAGTLGTGSTIMGGDNVSLASGQYSYPTGPMSYTEAGQMSNFLRNSLNEVDFASALQRPGVVPMGGDSIASSVDRSATGLPLHQQQQLLGSYITSRSYQNRTHNAAGTVSRSHGELGCGSGLGVGNALGPAPSEAREGMSQEALLRQLANGQVAEHAGPQRPSGTHSQHLASSLGQQYQNMQQSQAPAGDALAQQVLLMQALENPAIQAQLRQDAAATLANSLQQQFAYGNAQVYLQQQHAALQQQQMLLQQQQAAIALQQQQLQTYGFSPQSTANGSAQGAPTDRNAAYGSMGPPSNMNNGYFWVQSADGTPVLVSADDLSKMQGYGSGQQQSVPQHGSYPNGHSQYPYGGH